MRCEISALRGDGFSSHEMGSLGNPISNDLRRCGLLPPAAAVCGLTSPVLLRCAQPRQCASAGRRPREHFVPREGPASRRASSLLSVRARGLSGELAAPPRRVSQRRELPSAPRPKPLSAGRIGGPESGSELQPLWCRDPGRDYVPTLKPRTKNETSLGRGKRDQFWARKTRLDDA